MSDDAPDTSSNHKFEVNLIVASLVSIPFIVWGLVSLAT